jgi:hypothetical protein
MIRLPSLRFYEDPLLTYGAAHDLFQSLTAPSATNDSQAQDLLSLSLSLKCLGICSKQISGGDPCGGLVWVVR